MVSIDFKITKDGHTFKDAIVLEDNHTLTEEQIEAIKQARFNAWYELVTNPPVEQLAEVTE